MQTMKCISGRFVKGLLLIFCGMLVCCGCGKKEPRKVVEMEDAELLEVAEQVYAQWVELENRLYGDEILSEQESTIEGYEIIKPEAYEMLAEIKKDMEEILTPECAETFFYTENFGSSAEDGKLFFEQDGLVYRLADAVQPRHTPITSGDFTDKNANEFSVLLWLEVSEEELGDAAWIERYVRMTVEQENDDWRIRKLDFYEEAYYPEHLAAIYYNGQCYYGQMFRMGVESISGEPVYIGEVQGTVEEGVPPTREMYVSGGFEEGDEIYYCLMENGEICFICYDMKNRVDIDGNPTRALVMRYCMGEKAEFADIYQDIEAFYEIIEYDITDNPQSVYDNSFLCEALKKELEEEAQAQEVLGSEPATIDYFTYDFNSDGLDDYIVVFSGIYWSGSAGEKICLYIQQKDHTLRQVFSVHSRIKGMDDYVPVAVLDERIEGYYSFALLSANGRVWRYNAETGKYSGYEEEQIFFGKWRFEEVVSQHTYRGGDEGYEDLLGTIAIYRDGYFECGGNNIRNPEYEIIVYAQREWEDLFWGNQIGIEELLPDAPYFVYVQLGDKPELEEGESYLGVTLILKDEYTMYCYANNCIYKLVREAYLPGYRPT